MHQVGHPENSDDQCSSHRFLPTEAITTPLPHKGRESTSPSLE